jgi:hypothetical protein
MLQVRCSESVDALKFSPRRHEGREVRHDHYYFLIPSFPRKREPINPLALAAGWVPAFAGMTNIFFVSFVPFVVKFLFNRLFLIVRHPDT